MDRIVLPAIDMKADRVWLIAHNKPKEDEGTKFVNLIQGKLKEARIECYQEQADRIELFDLLRVLRMIILNEKGNFPSQCVCGKQNSGYCFDDGLYDVQIPFLKILCGVVTSQNKWGANLPSYMKLAAVVFI